MKKILWLDVETTDVDPKRGGGIHQLAYIIDINGEVVAENSFRCAPFKNDLVNAQSLNICGLTLEDVKQYPPAVEGFKTLVNDMHKHKQLVIGGYTNSTFDNPFFQSWWFKCRNELKKFDLDLKDYIHFDPLDVRILALDHFLDKRDELFGFKLLDVAKYLEIPIDESQAHDAGYDIKLTRQIYYELKKITQ